MLFNFLNLSAVSFIPVPRSGITTYRTHEQRNEPLCRTSRVLSNKRYHERLSANEIALAWRYKSICRLQDKYYPIYCICFRFVISTALMLPPAVESSRISAKSRAQSSLRKVCRKQNWFKGLKWLNIVILIVSAEFRLHIWGKVYQATCRVVLTCWVPRSRVFVTKWLLMISPWGINTFH